MSLESKMLISLLKLSKHEPVCIESVNSDARLPSSVTSSIASKLQNENLIYLQGSTIKIDSESRLKIAIRAIQLGADKEQVSNFLDWREFEAIAATSLEFNGYTTKKNIHFSHENKRWEIDVVGCQKPLVVCIDCKHWHHSMHPSSLSKMTMSQSQRTADFADYIAGAPRNFPCTQWDRATFVPVMLSLISTREKFCEGIPIVPVLQIQDFINQLPLNLDCLKTYNKKFSHL